MFRYLILSIIGASAGIVGTITGSSGGSFILPALLITGLIPDYKTAVGTTLLSLLPPVSLSSFYVFWKAGKYQLDSALIITFFYIFISYFIALLVVKKISDKSLYLFSVVYSFLLAFYFLYKYLHE